MFYIHLPANSVNKSSVQVQIGDCVRVVVNNESQPSRVVAIDRHVKTGIYAPVGMAAELAVHLVTTVDHDNRQCGRVGRGGVVLCDRTAYANHAVDILGGQHTRTAVVRCAS